MTDDCAPSSRCSTIESVLMCLRKRRVVVGTSRNFWRASVRIECSFKRVNVIRVHPIGGRSDASYCGVNIRSPLSPSLYRKENEYSLDSMCTLDAIIKTDLNPIPFSPMSSSPLLLWLMSQIRLTLSLVKPSSLYSRITLPGNKVNLRYGVHVSRCAWS